MKGYLGLTQVFGIFTSEGYLGYDEAEGSIEVKKEKDKKYDYFRYRDMRTGKFVSEKGLSKRIKE